jgi:hypothetical protein
VIKPVFFFCDCWNQGAVKAEDAHTFTKQAKNVYTNVVCQKADSSCSLWQERCALMVEFVQHGTAITSHVFRNTKKKRRTIQNKRHGMLIFGVLLLHDNACPHTATPTRALKEHNWELYDHPPCSLDLTHSNYHCLPARRTGCDHSASTITGTDGMCQNMALLTCSRHVLTQVCKSLHD